MHVIELVPANKAGYLPGDTYLVYSKIDFQVLQIRKYVEGDKFLTLPVGAEQQPVPYGELYCYTDGKLFQFRLSGTDKQLWMTREEVVKAIPLCTDEGLMPMLKALMSDTVKTFVWDSHFATPAEPMPESFFKPRKMSWTLSKDGVSYGSV